MNHTRTMKAIVALLALLIFLTIRVSSAQTTLSLRVNDDTLENVLPANTVWEKTYGGSVDDRAFFSVSTSDGYLVVGSSSSIVANVTVGWALKIDVNGNEVWNKTFLEGFGTELRYAVNLTDGFLLVGNQFMVSGDVNGFVAKIDNQGSIIWQTLIGGENVDKLFSGMITLDGFAVFGLTQSYDNNQSTAWVIKFNNDGNVIWNKTFGQTCPTTLRSGVLAQDGDYVFAGYTDLSGSNNYDFYLLKVHPDSSMVWNKSYGGVQSEKAYSMTKTVDGYVIVGDIESQTSSTDAWVLKVAENGSEVWAKTVGGQESDSPAYVTKSKDGGYLVAGFTFSFGKGQRDFWLFKISDQGQIIYSCTQGDAGFQEAYCVIEENNSYVMVGWTDPIGQPALIGKKMYDFYITELSITQNGDGTLGLQLPNYVILVFPIVLLAIFIMFKLSKKDKNKI